MRSLICTIVEDGHLVVRLDGEFDLPTRTAVACTCRRLARRPLTGATVLDLTSATFMDYATIRMLVRLAQARQDAGDSCTMLVGSPFLRRIIELTGCSPLVTVVLLPAQPTVEPHVAG